MTQLFNDDVTYISCADTAKLVRKALADAFPGQKFSVRSHTYAGGASVDVNWTDGPTEQMVDRVIKPFAGSTFDGSIDLRSYHTSEWNGKRVRFGADHVMGQRDESYDLLVQCADAIARQYGVPAPKVTQHTYTYGKKTHTSADIDRSGQPLHCYADGSVANYASTPGDLALQLAIATSTYTHPTSPTPEPPTTTPQPETQAEAEAAEPVVEADPRPLCEACHAQPVDHWHMLGSRAHYCADCIETRNDAAHAAEVQAAIQVEEPAAPIDLTHRITGRCVACGGDGWTYSGKCLACDGTGQRVMEVPNDPSTHAMAPDPIPFPAPRGYVLEGEGVGTAVGMTFYRLEASGDIYSRVRGGPLRFESTRASWAALGRRVMLGESTPTPPTDPDPTPTGGQPLPTVSETPDEGEPPSTPATPGEHPAAFTHDPVSHMAWLDFGGFPGQDTHAALKAGGWRWSRYRQQYYNNRRYALPPAGIAYEDGGTVDYASERADRLAARAESHQGKANAAYQRSNDLVKHIPFGQPILVGHHSERGHRAALKKSWAAMDRCVEEQATANTLARQAEDSRRHQAYTAHNVGAMARRRDRLAKELRDYSRYYATPARGTVNQHAEWERRMEVLRGEIADLEARIAAAGGLPTEQPDSAVSRVAVGDLIRIHGISGIVMRVNSKTITIDTARSGERPWPLKLAKSWPVEIIATAEQVAAARATQATQQPISPNF